MDSLNCRYFGLINIPSSKRGSTKARGRRQGGEAVEGGEKGQLDGKLAGTRISKGRKMPHINVIYIDLQIFVCELHSL